MGSIWAQLVKPRAKVWSWREDQSREVGEDLRRKLLNSVNIRAQECEQFLLHWKGDFLYQRDLHNTAPPFKRMFVEYNGIDSEGIFPSVATGVFVESFDLKNEEDEARATTLGSMTRDAHDLLWSGFSDEWRWLITWRAFTKPQQKVVDLCQSAWPVHENGDLNVAHPRPVDSDSQLMTAIQMTEGENAQQRGATVAVRLFLPAALAINFMHCKNVDLAPDPSVRRKGGKPSKKRTQPHKRIDDWKVLRISGARQMIEDAGESGDGIGKRLHICRGHFKDYRESGLFGKYKGIYWWDSQLRGDAESGTVHKEYEVTP
jgi:hypothetical protein